jgi:predicted TIM-barrel fold metal-dependent hydrolase
MSRQGLVDVDFWVRKVKMRDVAEHLDPGRRQWLQLDAPQTPTVAARTALPESQYFVAGRQLVEANEADDPFAVAVNRLDAVGLDRAIVNVGAASSISGYANGAMAADVAAAVNDWMATTWLGRDDRLRVPIVVSTREPERAAAEIRRAGVRAGVADIRLAYPHQLLGHRSLYPIYEAACELDLTVTVEAQGAFSGSNGGLTAVGSPSTMFEAAVSWEFAAQPLLLSALSDGLFERFPKLRLTFAGFGLTWLAPLMWRIEQERERGWLPVSKRMSRRPAEIVAEHVRVTATPLGAPPEPSQLVDMLAGIGGEQLILYGSGAVEGDAALPTLAAVDESWPTRAAENARAHYRLA